MQNGIQQIVEIDWNFDKVPDKELVACCYWEYARESAFICELRKKSLEFWKPLYDKGEWWNEPNNEKLEADLQTAESIGYPAEVFLSGIACPSDGVLPDAPPLKRGEVHPVTGSFPKPWQMLTNAERNYRKKIGTDIERRQLTPFKRGIALDAKEIRDWTNRKQRRAQAQREKVKREHPKLNDEVLLRSGKLKFPVFSASIVYPGGQEKTVVEIDWGSFTNDEIANHFRKWIKANRPNQYPVPKRQGHKLNDWRAKLTRLAAMRLMSKFSASQIVRDNKYPAIWNTKQFSGSKWGDVTKWYDGRREARRIFLELFPFLPNNEKPRSWDRWPPVK